VAKASDNVFPKIILGTGTAPSAPTDSSWKLYSQANGVYAKSSNSTVGPLGAGGGGISDPGGMAAGAALSSINSAIAWNSGTAFPTATAGDRYWRSDLGLECYYDGTRWLTVDEKIMGASVNNVLLGGAANTVGFPAYIPLGDHDWWITRAFFMTYVATTNDGTRYWKFGVYKATTGFVQTVLGSEGNTSADSASTMALHNITIGALVDHTTYPVISAGFTRVGTTPGAMTAGATIFGRMVIT
jgi:hypothetical protein